MKRFPMLMATTDYESSLSVAQIRQTLEANTDTNVREFEEEAYTDEPFPFHGTVEEGGFCISEETNHYVGMAPASAIGVATSRNDGGSRVQLFFQFSPVWEVLMVLSYVVMGLLLVGVIYQLSAAVAFDVYTLAGIILFAATLGVNILFQKAVSSFRERLQALLKLRPTQAEEGSKQLPAWMRNLITQS